MGGRGEGGGGAGRTNTPPGEAALTPSHRLPALAASLTGTPLETGALRGVSEWGGKRGARRFAPGRGGRKRGRRWGPAGPPVPAAGWCGPLRRAGGGAALAARR